MRILKNKARLHERVLPIQRHTVQKQHALGINKHPDIFKLKHMIARTRLGSELKLIAQSRAAAAQNAQTQPARYAFALERIADLSDCFRSNKNLLRRRFRGFRLFRYSAELC